ncbi:hypothetical protein LO80_03080 [Candidatus Francisella endociliophora]|uniref:Uncharacterized protein n=1 Tax=Candidatus Francisella endociliophora TaxID=653937 RepID=A0A097ENB3_9GAMM|nr:hypothetical protein [Francisella sp. FSC1006]AIT09057.1 hypothetical protein LO80_03080 [Francisella sp. FSC1006]
MPKCPKCEKFFTSNALKDHFDSCQGILIFSRFSKFYDALVEIAENHNLPHRKLYKVDLWIRDYIFSAKYKNYIRNKNSKFALFNTDDTAPADIFKQPDYAIDYSLGRTRRNKDYYDEYVFADVKAKNKDVKDIDPENEFHSKHLTNKLLEGGNLFHVQNLKGEDFYFIGERVLFYDEHAGNLKYLQDKAYKKRVKKNPQLKRTIEYNLEKYKKIFGTDNVYHIPNITYHLDCQMAYIKKGHFLVNNYEHLIDSSKVNISSELKKIIRKKQEVAESIVSFLQMLGFEARLYIGFYSNDIEQFSLWNLAFDNDSEAKQKLDNNNNRYSNLINGFHFKSNRDNKDYFVCAHTNKSRHRDHLTGILNNYNIEPIFAKKDRDLSFEVKLSTQEYLANSAGAIRCQTNFMYVGPLQSYSMKKSYNMKNTKLDPLFDEYSDVLEDYFS